MQHEHGKPEDPMGVLKITPKGRDMDTREQLYIHRLNEKKKKINC
jgi:hypothetical protein